jgi:hypothetical protein
MRDAIEEYLEQVMAHASLAPGDQARVRAELKDHLAELAAGGGRRNNSTTQEEIMAMLESEFGKPEVVGKAIAKAKGHDRTHLKKLRKVVSITLAAGLVLLSIRWAVAQPFYVPGKGAEPLIPQGSRVLVYKLASVFRAGDVVAFRNLEGEILLAIVKTDQGGVLTVSRNGEADREVPHARVIGRVVANTR